MEGHQFDALTKVWGSAASRRRVVGGLLAATGLLGWGGAGAQGVHSACNDFCREVFPPGRERGQCLSAAAHDEGLCAACGAEVERFCVDYTGAQTCCTADQVCGLLGTDAQACCLPPGAELPGGCNDDTVLLCCGFACDPGDPPCFVRSCETSTNTCINAVSPSVVSAAEGEIITEIIEK